MQFDPAQFWSHVITAFLGGCVFKLADFLLEKARSAKNIQRAFKIELARLQIEKDWEVNEAARSHDTMRVVKALREHKTGVSLAKAVYEIEVELLGDFWYEVGQVLGRFL